MGHPGQKDLSKIVKDRLHVLGFRRWCWGKLIFDLTRFDLRKNRVFLNMVHIICDPVYDGVSILAECLTVHFGFSFL